MSSRQMSIFLLSTIIVNAFLTDWCDGDYEIDDLFIVLPIFC